MNLLLLFQVYYGGTKRPFSALKNILNAKKYLLNAKAQRKNATKEMQFLAQIKLEKNSCTKNKPASETSAKFKKMNELLPRDS